jgi:uncharacterized damage-inducible protein DinB
MQITTAQAFLEYFESIRGRTLRVIRAIPPDKMDWTYRSGKFTLADLVRHLGAVERYMWAENVQGKPSIYPGHGKELADGYENVMAFFDRMHRESVEIFARLTDEDLQKKCLPPGGGPVTVWKWLRAMVEHEIHHRGQIYLYLAMLGVPTPPLYGMTEEQVYERSQRSPAGSSGAQGEAR